MIRTLVINLARSPLRRVQIETRLDKLGIRFEIVEGVDGQMLTDMQLSQYSTRAAFSELGREMHRNEVGCILSHIGIWKALVQTGGPQVLVLEDDMAIDPDFPDLIQSLEWIPSDAAVVNFSWDMATPIALTPISNARFICRFDKPVMRTGSYIIRRNGAEKLLRHAFPIRMPVDSLMGNEAHVGRIYGITPRPVQWDDNLATDTWVDSSMEAFAGLSRRSVKGLALRLLGRLSR